MCFNKFSVQCSVVLRLHDSTLRLLLVRDKLILVIQETVGTSTVAVWNNYWTIKPYSRGLNLWKTRKAEFPIGLVEKGATVRKKWNESQQRCWDVPIEIRQIFYTKSWISSSWASHLRSQNYGVSPKYGVTILLAARHKRAHPALTPAGEGRYSIYLPGKGLKAELT